MAGRQTIHKKVPDSITSWTITGFSLDPINGIGLSTRSQNLRVLKPFFVSLDLPYSVKRGEIVSIPVVVSNYMSGNAEVEITLQNSDNEFEFVTMSEGNSSPSML